MLEELVNSYDDVVDFVDCNEMEIYELFETGSVEMRINGRNFNVTVTVEELT